MVASLPRIALRSALALALALSLPACAAQKAATGAEPAMAAPSAEPQPAAPMAQPGQAAGGAEAQLAELDAAERQIVAALGAAEGESQDESRAPASAAPKKGAADTAAPKPAERVGGPRDTCSTACGALASMERAATHLCALTGEGDTRCASARDRLRAATGRVRSACPACAGR